MPSPLTHSLSLGAVKKAALNLVFKESLFEYYAYDDSKGFQGKERQTSVLFNNKRSSSCSARTSLGRNTGQCLRSHRQRDWSHFSRGHVDPDGSLHFFPYFRQ